MSLFARYALYIILATESGFAVNNFGDVRSFVIFVVMKPGFMVTTGIEYLESLLRSPAKYWVNPDFDEP